MATNGFVKFLTSAKAIAGIVAAIIILTVWFVTMNGNVKQNIKQLGINTPKAQTNREDIIGMKKDVTHIKEAVDRIEQKL